MAMFHFHAAFMLELAALAAGLVLLHQGRAASALLLRAAGWILIVGSLVSAACSTYYAVRYHVQGEFDHAYGSAGCPLAPGFGFGGGPMHHGGMGPEKSGHGMMMGGGEMMMQEEHPAPPAGAVTDQPPAE